MLFSLEHGRRVFIDDDAARPEDAQPGEGRPCASVLDDTGLLARRPEGGDFDYLFPDATDTACTAATVARLDALADRMAETPPDAAPQNSSIPPILTYFGQFIDHDITAGTDRETGLSLIGAADFQPQPRAAVRSGLTNLRLGWLGLDSVYGGTLGQSDFARKLAGLLRFPGDRAKMWIAHPADAGGDPPQRVPVPADGAADLLRLGRLLDGPAAPVTVDELRALPEPLRSTFVNPDGAPRVQRAIIGDARNDENLIVAQLHLAFLRFHNRIVDCCDDRAVQSAGREAVFGWARTRVRYHYQWLVLNRFLPDICDPEIVRRTLAAGAPLYAELRRRHAGTNGKPPVPLEFAVAAYRFGHSMVRAGYDFNRFFGRPAGGSRPSLSRAPFELLFAFTGGGRPPMPRPGPDGGSFDKLPSNWVIEWERFALAPSGDMPDRSARRIDTALAPPLLEMTNEPDRPAAVFQHLARRNLRRGYRLNISSGQDCVRAVNDRLGVGIVPLSEDELLSGATGPAIADGLLAHTPLWFYVLKEAEARADGEHLGPLGSYLVADTIAGLIFGDRRSYWHQPGSDGGRWHPRDGVRPAGEVVDSLPAFLRAALLL